MRKTSYKGRCEKRNLSKCADVVRTYDAIQSAYADALEADKNIKEIRCNVALPNLKLGDYMSDFVCVKSDGALMVRECVRREHLKKPMTVIDCMKRTMPKWVDLSEISDYQKCNEEYLLSATNTVISEIDTPKATKPLQMSLVFCGAMSPKRLECQKT